MPTRRAFLKLTGAAGVTVASAQTGTLYDGPRIPHSGGTRIKSVIRRDETTVRLKDYHGSFHMTWAADDRQYVTLNDGLGCCEDSSVWYNNHLFSIEGSPEAAKVHDVPGYPRKSMWDTIPHDGGPAKAPWYNAWGTLAVDQRIFHFVSTVNHASAKADGSLWPDTRFIGAKLIHSPDNGLTWHNQDGSTPVVWEPYERQSRETMVFYDEPQGAFCLLSILQMGRNYEYNSDGYIYVYGPNGNTEGSMNELVMFRVPKTQLLDRKSYEYFAGSRANGGAAWVTDIAARKPVHIFPRGWLAKSPGIPFGWFPSVVYNEPLRLFLMVNWGQGWTPGEMWFGKPSYLGFWVASQPWGPWTQIHEETAWLPAGDQNARAYQPQIPPKWIAADGRSFWLAWPNFQVEDQQASRQLEAELKRVTTPTPSDGLRLAALLRRARPYYGFNAQRVDLVVA